MHRSLLQSHLSYKSLLQAHLAQAEFRVAESEFYVAGQRDVVAELEARGASSETARELLSLLEELQALSTAHRDGLRNRLTAYCSDSRATAPRTRAA